MNHNGQTPEQVKEGKDRWDRGERLPYQRQDRGADRVWFCRTCGVNRMASHIPKGWYALSRASGTRETPALRLGIYCSARCMAEQMTRLIGIEDDTGAEWLESSAYRHTYKTR